MQKSKVEEPIAKIYNMELPLFSQHSDNAKTFKKAWNK